MKSTLVPKSQTPIQGKGELLAVNTTFLRRHVQYLETRRTRPDTSTTEDDAHPRPKCIRLPLNQKSYLGGRFDTDAQENHDTSWTQTSKHKKNALLEHAELNQNMLTHLTRRHAYHTLAEFAKLDDNYRSAKFREKE